MAAAATGLAVRSAVGLLIAGAISSRAYRRRSLNLSGAVAGFVVMTIHFAAGFRCGAVLLAFYLSSSKLTRVGEERKRGVDDQFKEGGQRNWVQVLCNSAIASTLAILVSITTNGEDKCLNSKDSAFVTALLGGIIGHYACSNGDTWSSEIGVLSKGEPRLITNLKPVRKGTNGAVSLLGLLAAAGGGFVIGITFVVVGLLTTQCPFNIALRQLLVVPLAAVAGLAGSLIDSVLGATVQFSGYCSVREKVVSKRGPTVSKISGMSILDNNGVNALSILLTTVLMGFLCLSLF